MRRPWQCILIICALLCGCEENSFKSSVPAYPVRISIDTKVGQFVHFLPTAQNSHVVVNREGYFLNGTHVLPLGATDAYGYGGVVVYVSINGYDAYDLACPNCAAHGLKEACSINGMFAECPRCSEQYDLASGYAAPQKGLVRETLRRLNIIQSDGKLTITQKQ